MIYYGIIDKIKDEHKGGIYGRKAPTSEELNLILKDTIYSSLAWLAWLSIPFIGPGIFLYKTYKTYKKIKPKELIVKQLTTKDTTKKSIIIHNNLLKDNYEINDQLNLFYGLFDNFSDKDKVFQKIMTAGGGSTLIIIERDSLEKHMHFGGENGKFNLGLYCSHPKNSEKLIPLNNSTELIKDLILEEILRAYEALGAKKIIIEDRTNIKATTNTKYHETSSDISAEYTKDILIEKQFGRGTFDPQRALQDSLFINDYPNIKGVITARIRGNQTSEKFTEDINLNIGLSIDVLNLFKTNTNFEYNRKWHFEVEFYDKNETIND